MSGTALALAATNSGLAFAGQWQNKVDEYSKKISHNDKIRFATIGMGIMGYNDTNTALKVRRPKMDERMTLPGIFPERLRLVGVDLVEVADLEGGQSQRLHRVLAVLRCAPRIHRGMWPPMEIP